MERLKKMFKNAQEFNKKFPLIDRGNGTFQHAENIFVQQLKHRPFLEWIDAIYECDELIQNPTTSGLVARVYAWLQNVSNSDYYHCSISSMLNAQDPVYEILDNGICEDGDTRCVRIFNHETNRVAKMKAGKLMRHILLNQNFSRFLSDTLVNYICEDFNQKFQSFASELQGEGLTLCTGSKYEDFEKIYDSEEQRGGFGSCMNNCDYAPTFYSECVDATAAWLEGNDGKVVARCVVFNRVHVVGSRDILRLAERQYAGDGNTMLMRTLVNKLIESNIIDGYKQVGASCHVPKDFVLNDGSAFRKNTYIQAQDVDFDMCPYMDSWKWMDEDYRMFNEEIGDCRHVFENTDGTVEDVERNWDDYLETYGTEELVRVCDRHGNTMYVFESTRDKYFTYVDIEDDYYPNDYVSYCANCGGSYVDDNSYYSEITDRYYCCEDCMVEAEDEYKEMHPELFVKETEEKA